MRWKAAAAALAVSFGFAASANAEPIASWKLAGEAGTGGTVEIHVSVKKRNDGRVRFYRVSFADLPMQCKGGPTTFSFYGGRTGVTNDAPDRDSFGLGVVAKNGRGERVYSWGYEGALTSRNAAEGTVRARGSKMPVAGGGRDACDTGEISWSASRVER